AARHGRASATCDGGSERVTGNGRHGGPGEDDVGREMGLASKSRIRWPLVSPESHLHPVRRSLRVDRLAPSRASHMELPRRDHANAVAHAIRREEDDFVADMQAICDLGRRLAMVADRHRLYACPEAIER